MKPTPFLATGITGLLAAAPLLAQQPADAARPSEHELRLEKLETWLRSKDERVQWRAVHAFVRMGDAAVPTLSALLQELPPSDVPQSARLAGEALAQLGPKAVECLPDVLKMLKDGTMAQRELALEVLARVGPHDQDEIQAYARATYDQLRVRAAKKLGGFGKRKFRIDSSHIANCMVRLTEDPTAGVDDLIEHLQGQSAAHREMALEWLEWHGDAAKRAIPAIREVLTTAKQPPRTRFQFRGAGWGWSGSMSGSNQEAIRTKAALLLLKLGATRDMAVEVHIQLVKHPDPAVRQRSVLQLGAAGDQLGDDGVRALRGATFDRDKLVAWDAITALGMIGPAARRAVPRLQTLAAGEDKAKAARAAAALRQIQRAKKKPQEAVRKTATGRDVE